MDVDIDSIINDAIEKQRPKKVTKWVDENPELASKFHALVDTLEEQGLPVYPSAQKFIDKVGGPPGHPNTVRAYLHDRKRRAHRAAN